MFIWSRCDLVTSPLEGGNIGINSGGIVIPFPNILFIPSSPSAVAAPVANAGTAFEIPFFAYGSTLAPRDVSEVNKFPQCFTDFVIWVLVIFISDPVPFVIDFLF